MAHNTNFTEILNTFYQFPAPNNHKEKNCVAEFKWRCLALCSNNKIPKRGFGNSWSCAERGWKMTGIVVHSIWL